ncbi:MAG TPA: XkdF-like putative serine protease domain-containing protein [Methanoculleus sp.]|jgi:hypothetical protein|nr:XkdF-like putative serine protease domain-containing protein [Methanoculleus sp.]
MSSENPNDLKTIIKSVPFHFQIDFKPTGNGRRIRGMVSSPKPDRENEVIETSAMRQALHNFMKHPILHLQHTERPVGIAIEAVVKSTGETHIEAEIFETDDTDDVWDLIEKGELSKFSIYGRRKQTAGQCHVSPNQRSGPCITKSLDLWSISIVGTNAVNQDTYLEIAKSHLAEDEYTPFAENLGLIYKSWPGNEYLKGDTMVPEPMKTDDPIVETPLDDVVKGTSEERLDTIEASLGTITKAIGDLAVVVKAAVDKPEEVKEEAITEDIKKATLEDVDAIVKAKVEEAVGDVKKAFDGLTTDVAELKKAVDEMKNTIVRKSGPLVYIPESEGEYNPYEANAAAIGA